MIQCVVSLENVYEVQFIIIILRSVPKKFSDQSIFIIFIIIYICYIISYFNDYSIYFFSNSNIRMDLAQMVSKTYLYPPPLTRRLLLLYSYIRRQIVKDT